MVGGPQKIMQYVKITEDKRGRSCVDTNSFLSQLARFDLSNFPIYALGRRKS